MFLKIITPEEIAYEGQADYVKLPGVDGGFEVLNNHAPILSLLKDGFVICRSKGEQQTFNIKGGVVEVLNNELTVLAEAIVK
jgi:F-type H+-transporting ATPase subunit epsilon